jgi:ketosteroid isomerase-like protein
MVGSVDRQVGEEIRRSLQVFVEADIGGRIDVLGQYITEDAVWMPPGDGSVEGKPAVLDYLEGHRSPPGLSVTPAKIEVSGNLASLRGTFRLEAGDFHVTGKMAQQWRRQSDSKWRIAWDIWNLDSAG